MRALIILVAVLLGACSAGANLPPLPPAQAGYHLAPGDVIQVNVYGAEDVSGQLQVADTGFVSMPLIGNIKASGLTPEEFRKEVEAKLAEGYVKNPRVSVTLMVARPFYVYGEVTKPGQYPFMPDMTVTNAIAVAGVYTYRANEDYAIVTRAGKDYRGRPQDKIEPEDVLRVPERYF
jgi:polysaccharide export outer membrane protein